MAHRLSRSLAALLIACPASAWIHAAEIGEAHVASHIGQQLVADVELTSLENAAAPVQARLASADVYRGASIDMPPVLASLNMSVMRRDGRQFLHLTSLKPVDADHLHVYLELTDGGQRSVRLATLWLSPDPNPAPVPMPVPARAPAAAMPATAVAAGAATTPATAVAAHSAAIAALATARARSAAAPMNAVAMPPAPIVAPAAAHATNAAATAVATPRPVPAHAIAPAVGIPAAPAHAPATPALPPTAKPAPAHVAAARMAGQPSAPPAQLPLHAAAPAACPQPFTSAQVQACVALDGKNAALHEQVGQLEGKVKALQAAMGGVSAVVPARPSEAAPPGPAAPAKLALPPKPAARNEAQNKRQAAQKPLPWLWIGLGAALLAAGGGALFGIRRIRADKARKAQAKAAIVVTPAVMGGVKSRLMTDPPAAARAVEPTME